MRRGGFLCVGDAHVDARVDVGFLCVGDTRVDVTLPGEHLGRCWL